MKYLSSLISNLSPTEIKRLKKYIKNNYSNAKNKKLWETYVKLVLDKKSEEEILQKLYGKNDQPPKYYFTLKRKLKQIVEEFFIITFWQREDLEKKEPVLFLRANALLATILDKRGLKSLTYNRHWKMNLEISRERREIRFEIEALLKRSVFNPGNEEITPEELYQLGKEYLLGMKLFLHINRYNKYHKLLLTEERREKIIQEIQQVLDDVEEDIKAVRRKMPLEHYYTLQLMLYKYAKDRDKLQQLAEFLYNMFMEDEDYPFHSNTINLLWYLHNVLLTHKELLKARRVLPFIKRLLSPSSVSFFIIRRREMMLEFYTGNIEEGIAIGEELNTEKFLKKFPGEYEVLIYFLANLYFVKGDFGRTGQLLMQIRDLRTDKEGWNISLRFLELMLAVEELEYDWFANRLDALRKFIAHHKIKDKYDLAFYEYLRVLLRDSLNFEKNAEQESYLREIEKHWDDVLPNNDVIPYHFWIRSKRENQPLYPMILNHFQK